MGRNQTGIKNDRYTKELAKILYNNHFLKSISLSASEEIEGSARENKRVIAVVGAAASYEAGVPSTSAAIGTIEEHIDKNKFQKDIDRLTTVYRLKKDDFETKLLALSMQKGQELRTELQKIFSHRYCPILSYELLAHMLKHRFIDVIINFNFDELLDQAISDEFGKAKYYRIISDGDCSEKLMKLNYQENLDVPIYIKPHGTSSHPSSLRFTREDYFGVPIEIKTLLENILTKKPICILCIGFGMQSFEFNHLLENSSHSQIYYYNIELPDPDPPLRHFSESLIQINPKNFFGISDAIQKLWQEITQIVPYDTDPVSSKRKNYYLHRGIDRHLIITEFQKQIINQKENKSINSLSLVKLEYLYFHKRMILELLISIVKMKGLININTLQVDRCGVYFELLYERNRTLTKKGGIDTILENIKELKTLPEMCEELGFISGEYGRELYHSPHHKQIFTNDGFDKWLNEICKKIFDPKSFFYIGLTRHAVKTKKIKDYLTNIFKGQEVEVTYGYNRFYEKIFKNPIPIRTYTALKWHTKEIIESNWDCLFIVAETGVWLKHSFLQDIFSQSKKKRKIYLIVSELAEEEIKFSNLQIEIRRLPWWAHNKHMTISCRDGKPQKALYFTRRLRSPYIDTVMLSNEDCKYLSKMFFAYWAKADPQPPGVSGVVTDDDIEKDMEKILKSCGKTIRCT